MENLLHGFVHPAHYNDIHKNTQVNRPETTQDRSRFGDYMLIFVGGIEGLLGYFTFSYLLQNALVYGTIFWLRKRADYQPTYRSPSSVFDDVISDWDAGLFSIRDRSSLSAAGIIGGRSANSYRTAGLLLFSGEKARADQVMALFGSTCQLIL